MISGQLDTIVTPDFRMARPPCIYAHSAAGLSYECIGPNAFAQAGHITQAVIKQGLTVASFTASLSFGTAGLIAGAGVGAAGSMEDAVSYHRTNLSGTSGPVIIFGISMGTTNALLYALEHPGSVAALVLFLPVADLVHAYTEDVNGSRSGIGTAWSVTFPTQLPSYADVQGRAEELEGVPILSFRGDSDPYSADNYDEFVAATGAVDNVVGTGLGHDTAVILDADLIQVADFIQQHS